MKVKILTRHPDEYQRDGKANIFKMARNADPKLHPLSTVREHVRAVNAAKLERVFAKPFLGDLHGHTDGVSCLCKCPSNLSTLISGACNGEVKFWHLPTRRCVQTLAAHDGFVRGLCVEPSGSRLISCGSDKTLKIWSLDSTTHHPFMTDDALTLYSGVESYESGPSTSSGMPRKAKRSRKNFGEQQEDGAGIAAETDAESNLLHSTLCRTIYNWVDHHPKRSVFATCGDRVELWDSSRMDVVASYTCTAKNRELDSAVTRCRFAPTESDLLAACGGASNTCALIDVRSGCADPIRRVTFRLRANAVAWHPREPFTLTFACEDYAAYTFDTRMLRSPRTMHRDHVAAVTDIDYSPTGREFCTASFDKTIRIFDTHAGHSREVYHTKRMQHVTTILWSLDNRYLLSGSDECNIRLWKAVAWQKLGQLRPRERDALEYSEALKQKFGSFPSVRRILKHRHLPQAIYNAKKEHRAIRDARKRHEENRRQISRQWNAPRVSERQKIVLREDE